MLRFLAEQSPSGLNDFMLDVADPQSEEYKLFELCRDVGLWHEKTEANTKEQDRHLIQGFQYRLQAMGALGDLFQRLVDDMTRFLAESMDEL